VRTAFITSENIVEEGSLPETAGRETAQANHQCLVAGANLPVTANSSVRTKSLSVKFIILTKAIGFFDES
jgi:hypothetical protein